MTTVEIVNVMKEYGIATTRQTIYEDIEVLNQYGYEVMCVKGKNNLYYVGDRKFERPEIQVLLNAVGAAKFLTEKKTVELTKKIAELLGVTQAEKLTGFLAVNSGKHSNERIYYSIDAITSAILSTKRKFRFCISIMGFAPRKYTVRNENAMR